MSSFPAQSPIGPPIDAQLDDYTKAQLKKQVEFSLGHMVDDAKAARDQALQKAETDSDRERAEQGYRDTMETMKMLATEAYKGRVYALLQNSYASVGGPSSVLEEQQQIMQHIRSGNDGESPSSPVVRTDWPPRRGPPPAPPPPPPLIEANDLDLDEEEGEDEDEETDDEDEEDEDSEGVEEGAPGPSVRYAPPQPSPRAIPQRRRNTLERDHPPTNHRPYNREPDEGEGYTDEEEIDDIPVNGRRPSMSYRRSSSGSGSFNRGGSPKVWRPSTGTPEPSGLSRTFQHANNAQISPSTIPRRGSINGTNGGPGSLQQRAGSLSDRIAERVGGGPPTPSPIDRERQNSARGARGYPSLQERGPSSSPRDAAGPSTSFAPGSSPRRDYGPYVPSPRPIPGSSSRPSPHDGADARFPVSSSPSSRALYNIQRSPDDSRIGGINIPRGQLTPDEPRGQLISRHGSIRSRGSIEFQPPALSHRRGESGSFMRRGVYEDDGGGGGGGGGASDLDIEEDEIGELDSHSVRSARSGSSLHYTRARESFRIRDEEIAKMEEKVHQLEEELERQREQIAALEEEAKLKSEETQKAEAALEAEAKRIEAEAKSVEAEAKRKEVELRKRDLEAKRRESEIEKRELDLRRSQEAARKMEEAILRVEGEAKRREAEAQRLEEEARKKEEDARRKEQDARQKEEDARQKEHDARQKEEDARKLEREYRAREEEYRKREDAVKRMEARARAREEEMRRKEEAAQLREEVLRKKEEELKRREDEVKLESESALLAAQRSEQDARRRIRDLEERHLERTAEEEQRRTEEESANEIVRQALQDAEERLHIARRQFEEERTRAAEEMRKMEQELERREQELEEMRRKREESAEEPLSPVEPLPAPTPPAPAPASPVEETKKTAAERRKEERDRKARERREEKRREEEKRLAEQAAEKARLEEEERLAAQKAAAEAEMARLAEEKAAEERRLEEERIAEAKRQEEDDQRIARELQEQEWAAQQQFENQMKQERMQEEFRQREAQYYTRTVERERNNSIDGSSGRHTPMSSSPSWANPHRSGPTIAATYAGDRSSTSSASTWNSSAWSNSRPNSTASSQTSYSQFSTAASPTPIPKASSSRAGMGSMGGVASSSPHPSTRDEVEWQRRAEERARQQAEQFKREQERAEREREAKTTARVMSGDDVVQLFARHANMWKSLFTSDGLRWTDFPWPVFKPPAGPEEITAQAIGAYVLSKYHPDAHKSTKDRIKDHIKRWHPDRFETKVLPKVFQSDRDKVKAGAGTVARGLNELLNRNHDD